MKRYKTHVLFWALWASALAVYLFEVADSGSQSLGNYLFVLLLHIVTFYAAGYWVIRHLKDGVPRLPWLIVMIFFGMVAIFTVVVLVSIAGNELTVGMAAEKTRTMRLDNYWEVVFILYAGVTFGCFYGFGKQLSDRHRDAKQGITKLQARLNDSEVMKLSSMMIPHLTNNLLSSLVYISKHRPIHANAALWLITQIVNRYAELRPDERINVAAELDIAAMFIELLEYELGHAPQIAINVDESVSDLPIIPMLLMLPLENISKYAVLTRAEQRADIQVTGEAGQLVIHAENDVRKLRKAYAPSTGNGLTNMEAKLKLLGVAYQFKHGIVNGRYVFHLELTLN